MVRNCLLSALCLLLGSALVHAQELQSDPELHPALTSKFIIGGGVFRPQKDLKLRAAGRSDGDEIEFDEVFRIGESQSTPFGNFRWRFGEKWSLWVEAWEVDSSGGAVLAEDATFDDLTFLAGSFAQAGVDLTVARTFFGRKLWTGDRYETGVGAGFHWLEISAFIEGEVNTNFGGTDIQRGDAGAEFPLPNIGGWWLFSASPRWALSARVDWLSASIDKYSGDFWNAQFGVHWQAFNNVGFTASAAYFELDGRIKDDRWRGQVQVKQYGPKLGVYFNW